jgi:hypothetical protein
MNQVKEAAMSLIKSMPDNCTYDDIHYQLYVKQRIQEALDRLGTGQTFTTDEVEQRVSQWLKSRGKTSP